jgi:cytochrome c
MYETSQDQAKRWVEDAIAHVKAVGKRIALAEFSNPQGRFVRDQLYIYVLSPTGTMLAHGVNERFVGEDFTEVRDSHGKSFIKEILEAANTKGSGWVDYRWYHPRRKRVFPKIAYCQKHDDLIICSAVYNDEEE